MVKERMDLLELLRKGGMDGDVDFTREALRVVVEGIMDAEVSSRIGAEYGERSPERVTQRNGYRSRAWDTRVGTMDLHIPKLREGSYFPSLLEPRRRSERALLAVIQQAYVGGVSTRRVDDLVKALGCEGISKSQVSRICQELDVVDGFMGRPLDAGPYPYLWLDALTQKVREDGRIVNVSVVVATAVNGEGKREIIGMDVGTSEDGAFWLAFLRSLSARGLGGVELVVSDAHQGLRGAIAAVFGGAKSGQFAYYICGTLYREGAGTCSARYLNAPGWRRSWSRRSGGRILDEKTIVALVTLVAEEIHALAGELSGRLEVIEAELGDVRRRLERNYSALETSDLTLEVLSPRILSATKLLWRTVGVQR